MSSLKPFGTPGLTKTKSPKLLALERQLTNYAKLNTNNSLEVGAGVIGQFPFFLTLGGLAIVFIANVGLSVQQSVRADQAQQENYFIATMVGMGLFVFGLLLSLNALSDVISFIRVAALNGDEDGPFMWLTAEQMAVFQSSGVRLSEKEIVAQSTDLQRQAEVAAAANESKMRAEREIQQRRAEAAARAAAAAASAVA